MQLTEVLHGKPTTLHPILTECIDFLNESAGLPVLKNLPTRYDNLHKVKVRQRKHQDDFTQTFNEAFDKVPNLRQRSVNVNGSTSFISESGTTEPFFVFPINGYKYQYSLEVANSEKEYQEAFDTILGLIEDKEVMNLLLKYTYTSTNLMEGINHGSEIIFYNIPYFYAARASQHDDYAELLEDLETWST